MRIAMINIQYNVAQQESANATMDFLSNRPFLAILFLCMQISCVLLCIGFALTVYNKSTTPQDISALILALIWLFYYKSINRWIIKNSLKKAKFDGVKTKLSIDDKSIFYRIQTNEPINIEWKKLKYVLKNKDGYIIPLTGITYAGKFLWIPIRGFENPSMEQEFLDLVSKFKLKLRVLK